MVKQRVGVMGFGMFLLVSCAAMVGGELARVIVPTVDVVAEPRVLYRQAAPAVAWNAPRIASQLVYNECVEVLLAEDDFCKVRIPSQEVLVENQLTPLTAWVEKAALARDALDVDRERCVLCTALWTTVYQFERGDRYIYKPVCAIPFGARLLFEETHGAWTRVALPSGIIACVPTDAITHVRDMPRTDQAMRLWVVEHARRMKGMPYCWGGTSSFQPYSTDRLTGFDCSGLVHRLYECCDVKMPRNSKAQYAACTPCAPSELRAGDLVFLARVSEEGARNIVHVMIYSGENTLIEAWADTKTGSANAQPLREVSVEERLGNRLNALSNGDICPGGCVLLCGRVDTNRRISSNGRKGMKS